MIVTDRIRFQHNTALRSCEGGIRMTKLKKEYVDVRGMRHKVEHTMVSNEDKNSREQIIQELFYVLTNTDRYKLA